MIGPETLSLGVILAGGRARRLGGEKAGALLGGRPMLAIALETMRAALPGAELVVVAKADTPLPELAGLEVWREPAEPEHPLAGLTHALARGDGRAVLVCPVDLPLLTAASVARLAGAEAGDAPAVLAAADGDPGRVQPLLGRYEPAAAPLLGAALSREPLPAMRSLAVELGAALFSVPGGELFNVNTPADLARAASGPHGPVAAGASLPDEP